MKKILISLAVVFALSSFTFNMNQFIKAKLHVTVLDDKGNPVNGALVRVFETEEDFLKKENEVVNTQSTNKKGKTLFTGLAEKSYFISAEKDGLDNRTSGVQTDTLVIPKINKINTIISEL